ncbi:MAG: Molybdate metabolism regulator, partial [Labilithrix sp.]|nr:Molybdate metabolism regulator [Labilithrix sp.]
FFAVGHLGRDEHAHRLAPLIRVWPTEGAFARAVLGLDVLATMKSDVALMLLHGISEKVKSRPLLNKAKEKMDSVAESLGLTAEELADRLVPTLGLDDDGSRELDFGARSFRVGFDENLRPFVREKQEKQGGGRLADLPKAGKNDNEELAVAAHAEWKALKKAAKVAATQQISRLEGAMIAQRRWEVDAFAMYLAGHPLVKHLVRRLVWGAYDEQGDLVGTFRVAEDGTYADADDETFTLPEGACVGVLHVLETNADTIAKWGERFSEYQLLQPFAQLGREVQRNVSVADVERFVEVDSLKLLGLERRGWRRGPVGDGGVVSQFEKEAGALRASLSIEPGLYAGDPKMNPTQKLHDLEFASVLSGPIAKPDLIFLSEVAADLRAVGALG